MMASVWLEAYCTREDKNLWSLGEPPAGCSLQHRLVDYKFLVNVLLLRTSYMLICLYRGVAIRIINYK